MTTGWKPDFNKELEKAHRLKHVTSLKFINGRNASCPVQLPVC
jgi:hypothetical protein